MHQTRETVFRREERVENTTRSGVFLTKFDRGVWEANENTVLSF